MDYPKKIMSIAELAELGFSKEFLRQIAHAPGAPVFRSEGRNSKIYFKTPFLDEFIERIQRRQTRKKCSQPSKYASTSAE